MVSQLSVQPMQRHSSSLSLPADLIKHEDPFYVKSSRLWYVRIPKSGNYVRTLTLGKRKRIRRVIIQLLTPNILREESWRSSPLSGYVGDSVINISNNANDNDESNDNGNNSNDNGNGSIDDGNDFNDNGNDSNDNGNNSNNIDNDSNDINDDSKDAAIINNGEDKEESDSNQMVNMELYDSNQNPVMLGLLSGSTNSGLVMNCGLDGGILKDEEVVIKILKPVPRDEVHKKGARDSYSACGIVSDDGVNTSIHDDASVSTLGLLEVLTQPDNNVWLEQDCYNINDVKIISRSKNAVNITLGQKPNRIVRHILFQTKNETHQFEEVITNFQTLLRQRDNT